LSRAIAGRSPARAMMETAVPLSANASWTAIADRRAQVEKLVMLRHELSSVQLLARQLSADHAGWYVAKVQRWASLYRGSSAQPLSTVGTLGSALGLDGADASLPGRSPTPVMFIAGRYARLAPADGHL